VTVWLRLRIALWLWLVLTVSLLLLLVLTVSLWLTALRLLQPTLWLAAVPLLVLPTRSPRLWTRPSLPFPRSGATSTTLTCWPSA
jgi:hypothetical protein